MFIAHQTLPAVYPGLSVAPRKDQSKPSVTDSDAFREKTDDQWTPVCRADILNLKRLPKSAVRADDYSAKFDRTEGWTGADGTYSVRLPNKDTLWLFSDTFWGAVAEDGTRAPETRFINNSVAVQKPSGQISFHHGGSEHDPKSVFIPPDGKGWFWLHDAVAQDSGKTTVMLGQFDKVGDDPLGFENVGAWLADLEMTATGPKVGNYQKLPDFGEGVFYGASVMQEGDKLYLYGVKDKGGVKDSLVARVQKTELSNPASWEFFNGEEWSKNSSEARPIATDVSYEYSVHRAQNGDYIMTSQGGAFSPRVEIRKAQSPQGPWSEPVTVWTVPEQNTVDISYNAKAHPELSDERGLLISYNMNSLSWDRNLANADIYRPRFIRVKDPTLFP